MNIGLERESIVAIVSIQESKFSIYNHKKFIRVAT
jgi:hypothetical protein